MDEHFPLTAGAHHDASGYSVDSSGLIIKLQSGVQARLKDPHALVGYQGKIIAPDAMLLIHHGLHVEIRIDRTHNVGRTDPAGLSDVLLEAALTTIQDCEDSVAAVDAEDKVGVYRNWLGLMKSTLQASFDKNGKSMRRTLNADRNYHKPDGGSFVLPGRSLMLVRHVGHFMMSDIVTLSGRPIPETFIDAVVTSLIALHNLNGTGSLKNSRTGSIYVVKPKTHGPEEVAFADELFARVEEAMGWAR